MKNVRLFIIATVFNIIVVNVLAISTLKAQGFEQFKTAVETYKKDVLKEKLFVHVNKSFFLTGEILWFKVYNTEASSHIPLNLSKVAYIELVDNNQTPVLQTKVELRNGQANGSVFLPASVANGNYIIRAYTAWMKNFGPESFFEKAITIVNLSQQTEQTQSAVASAYDIQFMPEGGNLVESLKSKVAVKVTGTNGRGAIYAGAIVDQNNDTVARFTSYKMGIGTFAFTPVAGKIYRAFVKVDGKQITANLPKVSVGGYVLHAEDKGTTWDITVNSKNANSAEQLYLLMHNNTAVQAAAQLTMLNNTAHYVIEKNKLAEGVNQLTLFNSNRQPICERLFFKRPEKQLEINAKTDAVIYNKRQKVNLDIIVPAGALKAESATMSLSVYRTDSLQQADNAGINSYLWLSSDVKGFIESPDYYFEKQNSETDEALDNLLLAQGWRAFKWDDVISSEKYSFRFLPEYAGEIVYGTIKNRITNQPAPNTLTYLAIPGTKARLFSARSDAQGRFFVSSGLVYGANEAVLQTNHFVDSTSYKIELASSFFDKYSSNKVPDFKVSATQKQLLSDYNLSTQVQNTYQTAGMRQYVTSETDSLSFYGQPAKTFALDQFTRFTTMEEVLREFVSYIFLVRKDKKLSVKAFNQHGVLDSEPLIMVDGVPLFDNNKIFEIDPLKIKKVDVLPERVYNGAAVFEGLLNFTTYKGDMNGLELNPKAILIDYEGIQAQRQFYSPVYDTADKKASRLPDFRNALYWNPTITVSSSGKASIEYFTSDMTGKYIGVLQGLSSNGNSGSASFTFEVK